MKGECVLSSFTKFLIVLLTVFSVFLCGTVVTYVAMASNWKEEYNNREATVKAMEDKVALQERQATKQVAALKDEYDALQSTNAQLSAKLSDLEIDLSKEKRENSVNVQRVSESAGIIEGMGQTVEGLRTSLEATRDDLGKKRDTLTNISKKLSEITAALDEKMVELESIEAENRRLLEVKTDLEKMIVAATDDIQPVTQRKTTVKLAARPAYDMVSLKALVDEVDLRNNIAAISIGSADGVSKGMVFHVTRGSEFICNIKITNVDQDTAAGALELVQSAPRVGDNVTTSL